MSPARARAGIDWAVRGGRACAYGISHCAKPVKELPLSAAQVALVSRSAEHGPVAQAAHVIIARHPEQSGEDVLKANLNQEDTAEEGAMKLR
jgi:hypothetical protein